MVCLLKSGITMLIHNKDDIEFVTEIPCLLGHPVYVFINKKTKCNFADQPIRADWTCQLRFTIWMWKP